MKDQKLKFESPIEEKLANELIPKLLKSVDIASQVPITAINDYRADFVAIRDGKGLVIECDGREFHDFNADRNRDINMMLHGGVDAVIRFRGCDVVFDIESCIRRIERIFPLMIHADSEWRDASGYALCSQSLVDSEDKPIVRCRCEASSLHGKAWIDDMQACSVVYRDATTVILQLKTPYWDWKRKQRIWKISDLYQFMRDKPEAASRLQAAHFFMPAI